MHDGAIVARPVAVHGVRRVLAVFALPLAARADEIRLACRPASVEPGALRARCWDKGTEQEVRGQEVVLVERVATGGCRTEYREVAHGRVTAYDDSMATSTTTIDVGGRQTVYKQPFEISVAPTEGTFDAAGREGDLFVMTPRALAARRAWAERSALFVSVQPEAWYAVWYPLVRIQGLSFKPSEALMYGMSAEGGCGGSSLAGGILLNRVERDAAAQAGASGETEWLIRAQGLLTQRLSQDYFLSSRVLYARFQAHPEQWPFPGQDFTTQWFLGDATLLYLLGETALVGGGLRYMSYKSPTVLVQMDDQGNLGSATPFGVVPWKRFVAVVQGSDPSRVGYAEDGALFGYDWDADVGVATADTGGKTTAGLTAQLGGEAFVGYQQGPFLARAGVRAMFMFVQASHAEHETLFARDLFVGPVVQARATF